MHEKAGWLFPVSYCSEKPINKSVAEGSGSRRAQQRHVNCNLPRQR